MIDPTPLIVSGVNLLLTGFLAYKVFKPSKPEEVILTLAPADPVPKNTDTRISLVHSHPYEGCVTVDLVPVDKSGKVVKENTFKRVCLLIPSEIDPEGLADTELNLLPHEVPHEWSKHIYSLNVSKW